MKAIKLIFISLGILVLVLLMVAFLLPRNVEVERSMLINAKANYVFDQVNSPAEWKNWSSWLKMDTTAKLDYAGPALGTGAEYSWASENSNLGRGTMVISGSFGTDSIHTELYFMDSKEPAFGNYYFTPTEEGVLTRATFHADMGYNPISRWMGLFMDKFVGPHFDEDLLNLKQIAEAKKESPESKANIRLEEVAGFTAITIKMTTVPSEIGNTLHQIYSQIGAHLQQENLEPNGAPLAIYHKWSEEEVIVEAGFPVESITSVPESMSLLVSPAQKTVTAEHLGNPNTEATHFAIDDWTKQQNLTITGAPWEVYEKRSEDPNDPTGNITRIYYPVSE